MTDEELIARLRLYGSKFHHEFGHNDAADRIEAMTAKLARAEWLLIDAAVQLEEGKIKTRRNRAGFIWQFLEEIKGKNHE